jgi:uncharacterized membrane protein YfcA
MIGYLFMIAAVALAFCGFTFIYKPPHRPFWAIACFLIAAMVFMAGFWSESKIGDDGNTQSSSGPTPTVVLMIDGN